MGEKERKKKGRRKGKGMYLDSVEFNALKRRKVVIEKVKS